MSTDLSTTIRGLLFRHDCVIIPGFGGFICNYVPASIDKATGMFNPPARRVSFNRNLNHNDGLLVGTISSERGVGYGEAREIAEKFAADLRKNLSRGDQVAFEHIGTFRTNQEGSIQFEPDRTANYNLGSYGMESFRFEPVAGYDVRKKVMKVRQDVSPTRLPLRKMLIRAAVAVPVLIALVLVPLKTDIFGTRLEKTSLNPLANVQFENNRQAIDEMPVITGAGEPAADTAASVNPASGDLLTDDTTIKDPAATAVTEETPPAEVAIEAPQVQFYLIAGSFKSVANAQVMAGQLRSLGYEPELMGAPDGYTRVAAKGFSDLTSANRERQKLSASVAGVWVLRNKSSIL